jgi:hypothetical protein
VLHVSGLYAGFRIGDPDERAATYWVTDHGEMNFLDDAQWADWDTNGDLLMATTAGLLQRRIPTTGVTTDVADLSLLKPRPVPAPSWADEW